MIPVAHVTHELSGRTRLKIPTERGNAEYFDRVGHDLTECPGIARIEINSRTGSLLLLHTESIERIISFAHERQLFVLRDTPHRTPLNRAAKKFAQMDAAIARFSLGGLDMRSIVFMILVMVSGLQIFKGQILAPASTLLWHVLELLLNARTPANK